MKPNAIQRGLPVLLSCLLFGWGSAAAAPTTELVKVEAYRVNLRARPSLRAEVVTQVEKGDILLARSFQDGWVEVIPDDQVNFWVHRDFIHEGEVTATRLNARAGAGINYSVVARLERGDRVEVRGESGEWLKIAPPLGSSLWVSGELVSRMESPGLTPEPEAPPEPAATGREERLDEGDAEPIQTALVEDEPEPETVRPPRGMVLVPLEGQGKAVQRRGTLQRIGFLFGRPGRFKLVQTTDGHGGRTICYVRGNKEQLEAFVGRDLTIRGRQYWAEGARYATVVPEQIIPHGTAGNN